MHTKVVGISAFIHGNKIVQPGQEAEFTRGDAEELQKSGLVHIVDEPQSVAVQAELEVKMEAPVQNKMAKAPSNKSKE